MYIIYIFCMYIYIYIEIERERGRQTDRQIDIDRYRYIEKNICAGLYFCGKAQSAMFRAIGQTSLKTVLFHKITTLRNYTVFDTVYEIQTQGKIQGKTKFKPNNLDDK